MVNLYLIEVEISHFGVDFKDFVNLWLEEVNFYFAEEKLGRAKHLYKVVGEQKAYIVIEKKSDELDKMMFQTPLMTKLGDQVTVTVTELLKYETFANNINEMISSDKRYEINDIVKRDGMFFWAEFNVGYSGLTLDEFLRLWMEEASVGMGAKSTGLAVDLWKCVGVRRVHVLLNFDSMSELDKTIFCLPIMQKNGHNVDLKLKPLVTFDEFATSLKSLC